MPGPDPPAVHADRGRGAAGHAPAHRDGSLVGQRRVRGRGDVDRGIIILVRGSGCIGAECIRGTITIGIKDIWMEWWTTVIPSFLGWHQTGIPSWHVV